MTQQPRVSRSLPSCSEQLFRKQDSTRDSDSEDGMQTLKKSASNYENTICRLRKMRSDIIESTELLKLITTSREMLDNKRVYSHTNKPDNYLELREAHQKWRNFIKVHPSVHTPKVRKLSVFMRDFVEATFQIPNYRGFYRYTAPVQFPTATEKREYSEKRDLPLEFRRNRAAIPFESSSVTWDLACRDSAVKITPQYENIGSSASSSATFLATASPRLSTIDVTRGSSKLSSAVGKADHDHRSSVTLLGTSSFSSTGLPNFSLNLIAEELLAGKHRHDSSGKRAKPRRPPAPRRQRVGVSECTTAAHSHVGFRELTAASDSSVKPPVSSARTRRKISGMASIDQLKRPVLLHEDRKRLLRKLYYQLDLWPRENSRSNALKFRSVQEKAKFYVLRRGHIDSSYVPKLGSKFKHASKKGCPAIHAILMNEPCLTEMLEK